MKRALLVACAASVLACHTTSSEERTAPPASVMAPAIEAPPELSLMRHSALEGSRRLVAAAQKLESAVLAKDLSAAKRQALELRRAYRRIEPLACVFAPVGSSQLDVGDDDEGTGEQPTNVGLQPISDVLHAEPVDFAKAREVTAHALRSARLVQQELGVARFVSHSVGQGLSRTVFIWGRRLDGSAAQHADEQSVDVMASGAGLVELSDIFASAVAAKDRDAQQRLSLASRNFARWLAADGAKGRRKLDGLLVSGELGAELRLASVVLGGTAKPPFYPRHPVRGSALAEPVTVATFPAWSASAPSVEKVQLGAELFFDTRLSKNGKLSCASCHDVARGLAVGGQRPLKVDGTPVLREVPSLYNAGFEPMLFWDGRASTLAEQAGVAIAEDMAGDFSSIAAQLGADAAFKERFLGAFPEGITSLSVRTAIAAFEQTLVSDETPFDRYVRGERGALDDELLTGFDVYFGKARCSRCHRLPLTSGAMAPRFRRTQVNVIAVPTKPERKQLDPDRGRGGVTKKTSEDFAFKTPSLRNLAITAPYFHNGAFQTLAQVVDFYAKGSGAGLGIDIVIDPDARPFEIDARERKALLAFLERGLRDAVVAPR